METTVMEVIIDVSQKIKNRNTIRPINFTSWYTSRRNEDKICKKYLHFSVHCFYLQ